MPTALRHRNRRIRCRVRRSATPVAYARDIVLPLLARLTLAAGAPAEADDAALVARAIPIATSPAAEEGPVFADGIAGPSVVYGETLPSGQAVLRVQALDLDGR